MPPRRVKLDLRVPADMHRESNTSLEEVPLSSLSPASLSTTFSSAAYYSTPHVDDDDDDMDLAAHDDYGDHQDNVLIKTEEVPQLQLDSIRDSKTSPYLPSGIPAKRKPGRPAKIKLPRDSRKSRVNERSKTGCLTCRKRKKKCDEAKPMCKAPARARPGNYG
jgi:hypothetical protein